MNWNRNVIKTIYKLYQPQEDFIGIKIQAFGWNIFNYMINFMSASILVSWYIWLLFHLFLLLWFKIIVQRKLMIIDLKLHRLIMILSIIILINYVQSQQYQFLLSTNNCWYSQFELSISLMRNRNNTNCINNSNCGFRQLVFDVDIDNFNCWYQKYEMPISTNRIVISTNRIFDISNGHYLLISTIRIADINNAICCHGQLLYCRYQQCSTI